MPQRVFEEIDGTSEIKIENINGVAKIFKTNLIITLSLGSLKIDCLTEPCFNVVTFYRYKLL